MAKDINNLITDNGYEDVIIFSNPDYSDAFIGITTNNRAVYDYDIMIKSLCDADGMTESEAIDFIEYNTIRALEYYDNAPVVIHRLEE